MIIIALPFPGLGFALWQFWPRRRLTPDVLSYVIIRASCSDVFPRHSPNGPCEHRLDGLLMRSSCRCPRQHCFKKFKDFDMRKKPLPVFVGLLGYEERIAGCLREWLSKQLQLRLLWSWQVQFNAILQAVLCRCFENIETFVRILLQQCKSTLLATL